MATASFADVLYNDKLTTGRQAEVGGKFDFWDGRGSATVALYDIRRKNISTPDANNPGVSLPVGEQSSRGLELASGLRLSRQVTLQANMAFVAPRYDDFSQTVNGVAVSRNGKVPTNTPRRIANVWSTTPSCPTGPPAPPRALWARPTPTPPTPPGRRPTWCSTPPSRTASTGTSP